MEFKTSLKNFTLIARLKGNSKTGKGMMISIVPNSGINLETVRSEGSSACGDCPHAKASKGRKHGSCYTYKRAGGGQGLLGGLHNVFNRCDSVSVVKFANQVQVLAELVGYIRIGEFGDPAADKEVAQVLAEILKALDPSVVRTGYTHQWRKKKAEALKGLVMASCDNAQEAEKALSQGWGAFEVIARKAEATAIHCPAQATKGIVSCDRCGKCDGIAKHVQVNLH